MNSPGPFFWYGQARVIVVGEAVDRRLMFLFETVVALLGPLTLCFEFELCLSEQRSDGAAR